MNTTTRYVTALFVVAAMSLATGCKSFDLKKNIPWDENSEVPEKHVVKMIAAWSEAALNKPGQPPMRGFGGRVYFYNRFDQPVQVDGNLIVYAYENRSALPSDAPPNRKFVITSRQLATHYSEGPMGPSYSIWLPWDELGGDTKDIDLIPTFAPAIGEVVVGVQARQRLPGYESMTKTNRQSKSRRTIDEAHAGPVMPVSYRESQDGPIASAYGSDTENFESGVGERRTEVTTIAVPEIVRKRMAVSRNLPARGSHAERVTHPTGGDAPVREYERYRATMSALQHDPPPSAEASSAHELDATYDRRGFGAATNRPTEQSESQFASPSLHASRAPFASRSADSRPPQQAQRPWPPGPYYRPPGQPAWENQTSGYGPANSPTAAVR